MAERMLTHDPGEDKNGNPVSDFVRQAVEALRDDPHTGKVLCDYYRTGMIQVFFVTRYVQGDTIRLAREHGYQLDTASERDGTEQPYSSWKRIGYAELVPAENDRERENDFRVK